MEDYAKMIRTRELFIEVVRMVMTHVQSHEEFEVVGMELKANYLNADEPTGILINFKKGKERYTFDFFAKTKDTMIVKLINYTGDATQYLRYPMDKFFETTDIFTDFIWD
jgi:hypothetical protein